MCIRDSTKAAQRLCLTQPAVTHHIQYLEQHYGCRLFTYEGKVLRLTEAGLRLREFTRSMAYNEQKMEQTMAASAPISLRVGTSKTIGEYVIAPKVEQFLRAHPDASFSLLVDNTRELLRGLEAGRLDFVLVEGFFDRSRYEDVYKRQVQGDAGLYHGADLRRQHGGLRQHHRACLLYTSVMLTGGYMAAGHYQGRMLTLTHTKQAYACLLYTSRCV